MPYSSCVVCLCSSYSFYNTFSWCCMYYSPSPLFWQGILWRTTSSDIFFQPLSMGVPQVCVTTLYVSKCASQTSFESADWSCRHSCFCLLPLGLLLLDRSELSEAVHTLPSQFEKHIKWLTGLVVMAMRYAWLSLISSWRPVHYLVPTTQR